MFQAILLTRDADRFDARIASVDDRELASQAGDANVTVAVDYSTVNYKDGLALTNRGPVVRKWPMVPGIDGAGRVVDSDDPRWKPGDAVVLNGWGAGETHWGCLAQRARLRGDWLLPLPDRFTTRQAMAIGTAGYTAALCVLALERHGIPAGGEVLVTGATGGVGSIAIALLAARGYRVVASTGKTQDQPYLQALGASEILDRATLGGAGKPLQRERWDGVVDSVGSHTLANACAQARYGGAVAACGLAQGMDLPTSVAPFILRGVSLLGVDSVMAPRPRREAAWKMLADSLDAARLESMTREVGLAGALDAAREIMAGSVRGRIVVDVNR
ncbi:MAG TPA: MDR family oxidoreductase [Burkholderiaceae bacterium]|nr:MDR family oxidoreductase [Burkholderiaceae bacterium]